MTSRPILFSAPMVKVILPGLKDQTRRIARLTDSGRVSKAKHNWHTDDPEAINACPYGVPGDHLWVRETWRTWRSLDHCKPSGIREGAAIAYEADGRTNINNHQRGPLIDAGRIRQSIFMRQWMSRITLEITAVRLEHLHQITTNDAIAEAAPIHCMSSAITYTPVVAFSQLWESIHGLDSWKRNPLVWVISFKQI